MDEENPQDMPCGLPEDWMAHLDDYRGHLLKLADARIDPLLRERYAPEDLLQETYAQILERPALVTDFAEADAPLYLRLRALLIANLTRVTRANFQTRKRNITLEGRLSVFCCDDPSEMSSVRAFDQLSASVATPRSAVARVEQQQLVREAVEALDTPDRSILTIRHFDGCSIAECQEILGLTRKAYNARYIKALRHLKRKLGTRSVFRKDSE